MKRTHLITILMAAAITGLQAEVLTVGPGKQFSGINEACAAAKSGDVIKVYPLPDNRPYDRVAVIVRSEQITISGVPGDDGQRIRINGEGFDYSGRGAVPRAIFQFDRGANGCVLENFELYGAHNNSHNGAGVRINQANAVQVRNCHIHDNDMGIMSNGDGTAQTGLNQRIEQCLIHSNGSFEDPGYNHNLYLGGSSVLLSDCEIHSSLTGHNVKSRAHHTRVECCYIHDSSNREFDLVDAKGDTTRPGSDAVLIGNVIVKDMQCKGNRSVIHFGQDGGHDHNGAIYLVNNTIVTPFISPVLELSAPSAKATLINNLVWNGGSEQQNQRLVAVRNAQLDSVDGSHNWLSAGFGESIGSTPNLNHSFIAERGVDPPFVNPAGGDFQLTKPDPTIVDQGMPWNEIDLPDFTNPGQTTAPHMMHEHANPVQKRPRYSDGKPDTGACEFAK